VATEFEYYTQFTAGGAAPARTAASTSVSFASSSASGLSIVFDDSSTDMDFDWWYNLVRTIDAEEAAEEESNDDGFWD
jgi:hypothetical protein